MIRKLFLALLSTSLCLTAHAATFTGTGTDDQGNTITFTLTEQIAPATLYFAATGNDVNDCKATTRPCQAIAKLNAMTLPRGGTGLFNGGDTFVGNFNVNIDGNGDPSAPLTIGSYGTGKATLVSNGQGETGIINIDGMSGVIVQDLNIRGSTDLTKVPRAGIRIANNTAALRSNITIQRVDVGGICYFQATQPSPTGQGTDGFEIEIAGYPGTGGLSGINIFDSKLHGLNGPGSCDDTGIGGFGNGVNIGNVHVKNVEVYNIGGGPPGLNPGLAYPPMGDGIEADGWHDSLIEFSTAHDLGANYRNAAAGPAGFLTASADHITISRCLAYNIVPSDFNTVMVDFIGFDLDNGTSNSKLDSNYSHDNYNSGFMFFNYGDSRWTNNTMTNNISQNDQRSGLEGFGGITITIQSDNSPAITIQNNTTWNNRTYNGQQFGTANIGASGVAITGNNSPFTGTISKNITVTGDDVYGFASIFNSRGNTPAVDISNNAWFNPSGHGFGIWWDGAQYWDIPSWLAATGKGAGTQTGDPHFSAPGTGPAGYTQATYPGWGAIPQASYGITN